MELSESDVCKLANKLASKEEREVLEKLVDRAVKTKQIFKKRVLKGFLPLDEGGVELPEHEERMQIVDDADKSRRMLNSFCEDLIRRHLEEKVVDNKSENNGGTSTSKDDKREEKC